MSSSLGNFATVAEAVEEYGTDVVRTFLLSTAYHNSAVYGEDTINEAIERFERLERGYERAVEACDSTDARTKVEDSDLREAVETTREEFETAMNDDFNTRASMSALLELTGAINTHLDAHDEYDYRGLRESVETIEEFAGGVFGLSLGGADGGDVELAQDVVDLVLEIREQERDAGNYERADELRDELEALGVEVQDTDDGPVARIE